MNQEAESLQNELRLLHEDKEKFKKYCDYVVRLEKQLAMRTKKIQGIMEKLKQSIS